MQTLLDTPTQLVIKVRDVEYSRLGKIINFASLIAFTIIFFYLFDITQRNILTALLTTLSVGSPIFLINNAWLGRPNIFFTFDRSLERLVVERKSLFASKVKVREYWLHHINDVKVQCVETFGVAYGVVIERCQCKIILLGAVHVEIGNDLDGGCDRQLAQFLADRIKVFLAN
ncbi:MAG: hypothetical protein KME10_22060 [Plectolyngbya sp. WJT66-NPBG17]|jgi:hypothetical protein|nr:hypothetical protein [Plectolyngbya sp. WJT66-NPBG17]